MTTSSTKAPQADKLREEFPDGALRQLKKGGSTFTYIPASEVVARLNTVLGVTGWKTVESEAWIDKDYPEWVIAKYTIEAVVDGQTTVRIGWGGQKIKMSGNGGPLDLGDEFKGASSDALKKCVSHLGVGLYLSRDEEMVALEEESRKEKAGPDLIKVVEDYVANLDEETKAEFANWWKSNHIPKLAGGRVTVEQIIIAANEFNFMDRLPK